MTHSDSIAKWVSEGIAEKYTKGQEQHGGDIRRKNVLAHLSEELFDSLTYLAVLHEQMQLILEFAEMGWVACDEGMAGRNYFSAIINIVRHGNEDGSKEEEREEEAKSLTFDKYYNKDIAERMFAWLTK